MIWYILDPPYYPLNNTSNFTSYDSNTFLKNEQLRLFELFDRLNSNGIKVVQTNSDTDVYKSFI